jgi:rhodanese-related sulfurtransferase
MKKIYFCLVLALALTAAAPVWAATAPAKKVWKPIAPKGYAPITWASAPGIASFYQPPTDSGAIDFLTRIYLPQNQINFILATSSPKILNSTSTAIATGTSGGDITNFPNLSFKRLAAETAKIIDPAIKFLWDVSFFNMKNNFSDLSMAAKYSVGTTTIISSGSRSVPDMALPRKMLLINNQTGRASIKDFDSSAFTSPKSGDQALEGFSPAVAKSDSAGGMASRLFLGVDTTNQELIIYCSQAATVNEASNALIAAGVPLDNQLEADGGASAACGYNLPGQYFVEPTRSLPILMGAKTILARGTANAKTVNVRSGPGTKYPIVAHLAKGAAIIAYGESNGWYRIGDGQWAIKTLIK